MSKCVCISCKKVISDTCDQNHVKIIRGEDLDVLEFTTESKSFSDIRYDEFKKYAKGACMCEDCFNNELWG